MTSRVYKTPSTRSADVRLLVRLASIPTTLLFRTTKTRVTTRITYLPEVRERSHRLRSEAADDHAKMLFRTTTTTTMIQPAVSEREPPNLASLCRSPRPKLETMMRPEDRYAILYLRLMMLLPGLSFVGDLWPLTCRSLAFSSIETTPRWSCSPSSTS